ncbi:hypothetical protein V5799_016078 [Amblyomma americanum]|uniref:Secreted protein n=1 Tax=Amblyomma americanum TaxID=6943 RepID=A0AAQ4F6U6_AMBAM
MPVSLSFLGLTLLIGSIISVAQGIHENQGDARSSDVDPNAVLPPSELIDIAVDVEPPCTYKARVLQCILTPFCNCTFWVNELGYYSEAVWTAELMIIYFLSYREDQVN